MKNKKNLILLISLALLLLIVLILLAARSFYPLDQKTPVPSKLSLEKSEEKTKNQELEKIKKQMEQLNNQTLEVKEEKTQYNNDQESTEAEKYEKDFIEKSKAQAADGFVTEKTETYLKVKLSSVSYTWISKVNITPNTKITKLNPNAENSPISLSEIEVNSKIVVTSNEKPVTEEEFDASSIIKVN